MENLVISLCFNNDNNLNLMVDIITENFSEFDFVRVIEIKNKGTMLFIKYSDLINNISLFEGNNELNTYICSLINNVTSHSNEIANDIKMYNIREALKEVFIDKLKVEDENDRNL